MTGGLFDDADEASASEPAEASDSGDVGSVAGALSGFLGEGAELGERVVGRDKVRSCVVLDLCEEDLVLRHERHFLLRLVGSRRCLNWSMGSVLLQEAHSLLLSSMAATDLDRGSEGQSMRRGCWWFDRDKRGQGSKDVKNSAQQ